MPIKKNFTFLFLLAVFCIPFFFLNIQNAFPFGDDWAQYVKEGQNIATGKPYYASNYVFNATNTDYAPPQYPPGYPLLLAPVIYFFGVSVKPIIYLNALFLSGLLFSSFYYFRKRSNEITALCLSLILCYISYFIEIKRHALSDLPCTLFVTVYFALRSKTDSFKRLLLLCLTGVFCILIRSQAILLVLAEGIVFVYEVFKNRKQEKKFFGHKILHYPSLLLACGIMCLFLLINNILFPAPVSTIGFYKLMYANYTDGMWPLVANNANFLMQLFEEMFSHNTHDPFFQVPVNIIAMSAISFGLLGFVMALKKSLQTDIVFFVLMCGVILVTPIHQGPRYIMPVVPIFLLCVKDGMAMVLPRVFNIAPKKLAVICAVIFLALGYDDYEKTTHPNHEWAPEAPDTVAFNYIKTHVKDNEIILFAKPRLLTLYTDKKAMNISWQLSLQKNKQFLDSMQVHYLLFRPGVSEDIFSAYLRQPDVYTDSVKITELYTLYRLK